MTYSAMQIAQYIIDYCNKYGMAISNLKLQKLLYYSWVKYYDHTHRELFLDDICAWQLGPVVPIVYSEYCAFGGKNISREYDVQLTKEDESTLQRFMSEFGCMSAGELVDKSHQTGGAWDVIYNNGKGSHAVIPFDLIVFLECIR